MTLLVVILFVLAGFHIWVACTNSDDLVEFICILIVAAIMIWAGVVIKGKCKHEPCNHPEVIILKAEDIQELSKSYPRNDD